MRRLFTTILAAATLAGGFAKNPPPTVVAEPELPDSLRATYLYTDGVKRLVIERDSVGAQRFAREALAADSTYAPAQYLLARLGAEGNAEEAVRLARKAYESDKDNRNYLEMLGESLVRARRYNDAIEYYSLLTRNGSDHDHFRILSILYESNDQPLAAIATLDSAEVKIGRQPMLVRFRQRLYLSTLQYEKAEAEARRMIAETPYIPDSYLALAEVGSATGRDSLALASFSEAIRRDSTYLASWMALGDHYYKKHDFTNYLTVVGRLFDSGEIPLENKISQFNSLTGNINFYRKYFPQINALAGKLMIRYPADKDVTELYAKHLIASGQIEAALALYKQNLDEETASVEDFGRIIEIEGYLEHMDSVGVYLAKALRRYPHDAEMRAQQGHVHSIAERYSEAVESYKEALKYAQNDTLRGRLWGYIGDTEHQRGDAKRCYAAFERALKYYPDNASVLNNYAYFLSVEGRNLDRALAMATRATAISQNNATFLDTLAWVFYRLGRYDEAKKHMQQALSFDRNSSPEMALHYGDILDALGDTFMAKTYWRKALERGYDAAEIERRLTGGQYRSDPNEARKEKKPKR
ncbi:MAG: tetratricopeptide repeat protein [Alistipes sp.]|nr:tetratricopeptide repeat protein [Alistipes sp.]